MENHISKMQLMLAGSISLILPLLFFFGSASSQNLFEEEFKVTKVFDGDTFEAVSSANKIRVRLAGIDAPETAKQQIPAQPYSRKSKEYLEKAVLNKTVQIKGYGRDQYDRQLAEVFVSGRNISIELLESGLAEVYRGKLPEALNAQAYRQAEMNARNSRKGSWSLGDSYVSPKTWRKLHNF